MTAMALPKFAFIPADNFGTLKATDRKLIRSHCMRGKNKKKAGYVGKAFDSVPTIHHVEATQPPLLLISGLVLSVPAKSDFGEVFDKSKMEKGLLEEGKNKSKLPKPPPADLSLVKFPVVVDTYSRELLFKFFNVARSMAYPVEFCVDFDLSKIVWFQWLSLDVAYLHSVLLGASVIHDFIMQRRPAKTTYFHLRKTIAFLNKQLSDSTMSLRDSTVAVVVNLAMLADIFGDHAAAKAHIAGLQQMVRLRGGLEGFSHNTKLHVKIRRLDLCVSLNTGEHPHFLTKAVPWASIIDGVTPIPTLNEQSPSPYTQFIDVIRDPTLVVIFRDFQYFTKLMNGAAGGRLRLRDTEFQNFTCSIQYRLLQLQDSLDDIVDECFRLALLAFLTTTFQIPGKKIRYTYLASRFRECCSAIEVTTPYLQDLMLWLLMMGAISIYGTVEPWLCERWQADVPMLGWPETRRLLQDVMWIDMIHDKPGSYAFEVMSHQDID